MKIEPLVSIIMNCYNGESYLREAVNSVINQTYKNWELIFWDNKSTDRSADIFKEYQDKRLKYFCADLHSKILYQAKNLAIKKANGQFIASLDVDDWWIENKLEKQIPLFDDEKVGLVYGNCWLYFQKTKKKNIFKKKLPTGMIAKHLINDYVIGSATYLIRKKFFNDKRYQFNNNFHVIGDFDLNVRLACNFKINCVQEPVAYIRRHDKNESLISKNKDIEELKIWYYQNRENSNFTSKELLGVWKKILYLEIFRDLIIKKTIKNMVKIAKYPISKNKIKLIIALFTPKSILKQKMIY